jgi:3-ketosteroid 9alpha-monooxygenase subunit A
MRLRSTHLLSLEKPMTKKYQYAYQQPGRFARGWHIVLFSQELDVGDIKPLHYFDQDLVIFRGEDNRIGVLDAFCPHLGAHLGGVGSKVVGNNIRCPFHGWQFNKNGACVHIDYASKIPERAQQLNNGWPVVEKNGFIAIWHDHDKSQPDWELPDIPGWNEGDWGQWQFHRTRMKTQGHEIIENIADKGHFQFVHGAKVLHMENTFDGITVSQHARTEMRPQYDRITPPDTPQEIVELRKEISSTAEGVATYHGPAVMYYHAENDYGDYGIKAWWVNQYIPVNDQELDLASGVVVQPLDDRPVPEEFIKMYPLFAHTALGQDKVIWETKKYRTDPILCDGDGPINKVRQWYEQFYKPAG